MSRETAEYLRSLYNGHDDQGPQVNWTRGFEGNSDQYNQYTQNTWHDTSNDDANQSSQTDYAVYDTSDLDLGW